MITVTIEIQPPRYCSQNLGHGLIGLYCTCKSYSEIQPPRYSVKQPGNSGPTTIFARIIRLEMGATAVIKR